MAIAGAGGREIVKGRSRAIAIGEERPGRAPTSTPMKTPRKIASRAWPFAISEKPSIMASIGNPYWMKVESRPGSK